VSCSGAMNASRPGQLLLRQQYGTQGPTSSLEREHWPIHLSSRNVTMFQYSKEMASLNSQRISEATSSSTARRYERNSEKGPLAIKSLSEDALDELRRLVSSNTELISRENNETEFHTHARVFNGAIRSPACLLVKPVMTKDVSE
jgi:hypothetical protein